MNTSSSSTTSTKSNRSRSASSQFFRFDRPSGAESSDGPQSAEESDGTIPTFRPSFSFLDALPDAVWFSDAVVQFHNCRVLRNHQIVTEDVYVQHGKILLPQKWFFEEKKPSDIRVDCQGHIIAPGFIDVQINGAYGVDFSSSAPEELARDLDKVAKGLPKHGVTSFCPTFITSTSEVYHARLPACVRRNGTAAAGAGVLGAHVEGPFISHAKYGAHDPEFIRPLENGMETVESVYGRAGLANIAMITLAPELPGALETIPRLVESGIVVSVGHSASDIQVGESAVAQGANMITHLFNAMVPFHHRDPGLVGLLATKQRQVYYGLIVDGMHTHPAAVTIAYRTNPKGCVLVTDAIAAMGLPPGDYHLGTMKVSIAHDKAVIAGTETLAGSVATMDKCVQLFRKFTGCTLVEALEAASLHPATLMNITSAKGSIEPGKDADFVVVDDDLRVWATYIQGQLSHSSASQPPSVPP